MTRRDDALDTGLRLFADLGYAATTTSQIEEAMGLRPGAGGLFRHVTSKQALLEAAVERALARRFEPPAGPFASPAAALAASVLSLVDADPDLWRLLLREGRRLPVDMDDVYRRLVQPAFDQAIAFGHWYLPAEPDVAARVVVGLGALLYLRVSDWTYGRPPGGLDEGAYVRAVEALFGGPGA